MRVVLIVVTVLSLSLAGLCLLLLRVNAQQSTVTWQSSESAEVQLGVRDKYGSMGEYTADFVVIGPKNEKVHALREVKGDDFGVVYFPEDFTGWAKPGKYTWKCLVNGKPVVDGKFQVTETGVVIRR